MAPDSASSVFSFSDSDLIALLEDLACAEKMALPSRARHSWVVANQIRRKLQSPPPTWVWLLMELLDKAIPILIEWLKKHYGNNWVDQLQSIILQGRLPWSF